MRGAISSIIDDFRDLRSTLNSHFEQEDFTVPASERNDFLKPLDRHSYETCLQAIAS
jgi:hypothetical protein